MDTNEKVPVPNNLTPEESEVFKVEYLRVYGEQPADKALVDKTLNSIRGGWDAVRDLRNTDGVTSRAGNIPTPESLSGEDAERWNAAFEKAFQGPCKDAANPKACAANIAWDTIKGRPSDDDEGETEGKVVTASEAEYKKRMKLVRDYAQQGNSIWAQKALDAASQIQEVSDEELADLNTILQSKAQATVQPEPVVQRRFFSDVQRKELSKSGKALPDGSFPIVTKQDLENAIQAIGRANNRSRAMAHIMKRARSIGAFDLIPDTWKSLVNESIINRSTHVPDWYILNTAQRITDLEDDLTLLSEEGDGSIDRPDYTSSDEWNQLPITQRTLSAEIARRAVGRNYSQACDDMLVEGWNGKPMANKENGEMEFRRHIQENGEPVLHRAILVRKINSNKFYPKVLSRFLSQSTAIRLDADEARL